MTCIFHQAAPRELREAAEYYEGQRLGLGRAFGEAVHDAIQRIVDHPDAWPAVPPGGRRCLVRRFPCCVVYRPAGDTITIVAVMHLHRRPGYWADRVG